MGNTTSGLYELEQSLGEPICYETVLKFYNYLQEHTSSLSTSNYCSRDYLILETEMIDSFIHLVSIGHYRSKDEIEQIAKLIDKIRRISSQLYDPEAQLNYIR